MTVSSNKQPTSYQSTSIINLEIYKKPAIHSSFLKSLIFQILITIYYLILIFSGISTQNTRVFIYCLLFIANQSLKMISYQLNSIDPLSIQSPKIIINLLSWGIKANMTYLLTVLTYLEQSLPTFLMIIHFILANWMKNRPDFNHDQKGRFFYKIMDFVNPILIYSFLKQFDHQHSELSIIFLIFMCGNLFCASQVRQMLAHHQTDFVGWSQIRRGSGKIQKLWDRKKAFKQLIIGSCVMLVIQNILLLFQSTKYEVTLNILHTLIIAIVVYIANRSKKNFQN